MNSIGLGTRMRESRVAERVRTWDVGAWVGRAGAEASWRTWPVVLRRLYWIGLGLLGVQLIGFSIFSYVQAARFGLSEDFSFHAQAWYLLAHGVINPASTVLPWLFWQDHSAFLFWLSAPFWYLWPHPVTLLWLQDLAVVTTEMIAWRWMCESLAAKGLRTRFTCAIAGVGMVSYLANPWILWALADDFHVEAFSIMFVMLVARDLFTGRRRVWLWVLLALLSSNLAATYLFGLGVAASLTRREWRLPALLVAGAGLGWLGLIDAIHGAEGSGALGYLYLLGHDSNLTAMRQSTVIHVLEGALSHPGTALAQVWRNRSYVWADVMSSGPLGLLSPWSLGVAAVAVGEGALSTYAGFISPNLGYQNLAEYLFLPVGTVLVLAWVAERGRAHRRGVRDVGLLVACAVLGLLSLGWGVLWIPRTSQQWLLVPRASAAALAQTLSEIPANAEVVVSQGVSGPFAGRAYVYTVYHGFSVPIETKDVWFVVTPYAGIEIQTVPDALSEVAAAAALPGARVRVHRAGVWAIEWPDASSGTFTWSASTTVNVAGSTGATGRAVLDGPPATWYVGTTGQAGYVVDHDYFQVAHTGRYVASVRLASRGPLDIELWDATANRLLARVSTASTSGQTTLVRVTGQVPRIVNQPLYAGVFPWYSPPPPALAGDQLEVRVYAPESVAARIYSVGVAAART